MKDIGNLLEAEGAYVTIAVNQQAKKFGLDTGGSPSAGPPPIGR